MDYEVTHGIVHVHHHHRHHQQNKMTKKPHISISALSTGTESQAASFQSGQTSLFCNEAMQYLMRRSGDVIEAGKGFYQQEQKGAMIRNV